jgi:hypothetical protein
MDGWKAFPADIGAPVLTIWTFYFDVGSIDGPNYTWESSCCLKLRSISSLSIADLGHSMTAPAEI